LLMIRYRVRKRTKKINLMSSAFSKTNPIWYLYRYKWPHVQRHGAGRAAEQPAENPAAQQFGVLRKRSFFAASDADIHETGLKKAQL